MILQSNRKAGDMITSTRKKGGERKPTIRKGVKGDERIVFELFQQSPNYCQAIGEQPRDANDVKGAQVAIENNPKHHRDIILFSSKKILTGIQDHKTKQQVVGFIDYKVDFPKKGEVVINLLLISEKVRRKGLGKKALKWLENELKKQGFFTILAPIYGERESSKKISNQMGVEVADEVIQSTEGVIQFWESVDYTFNKEMAKDAQHLLLWYSKPLLS